MPTTTNNGWPTPADTDLVKNGADAIRDLGNAIDTTLGVYSPATPGLVKINTTSFSGVSSQSINDVFSTTYTNYRILLDFNSSGTGAVGFRFRVSGADNSTANYSYQAGDISSTTFSGGRGTGQTSSNFGNYDSGGLTSFTIDVFNPFETLRTNVQATNFFATSGAKVGWFYTQFTATTSFTGFTLLPDTGNITGKISVYGMAK